MSTLEVVDKVVALVLDHPSDEIARSEFDAVAVSVERDDRDFAGTWHEATDACDAQASFPILSDLVSDNRHFRVE